MFFSLQKITDRAKVEAAILSNIKNEQQIDEETIQQWVCDVRQWAVTGKMWNTLMSFHVNDLFLYIQYKVAIC